MAAAFFSLSFNVFIGLLYYVRFISDPRIQFAARIVSELLNLLRADPRFLGAKICVDWIVREPVIFLAPVLSVFNEILNGFNN